MVDLVKGLKVSLLAFYERSKKVLDKLSQLCVTENRAVSHTVCCTY